MTSLFKEPLALARRGPLGPSIDAFAGQLEEQGYGKHTVGRLRRLVADFCCWITLRRIHIQMLGQEEVERYLKYRKHHRYSRPEDPATLLRFVGVLVQQGLVVQKASATDLSPVELLAQEYRQYLQRERRLGAATIVHYLNITGRFLKHLYG